METETRKRFVIDPEKMPAKFPTHKHEPKFWEALGRAVATFGFLEETLGKAIFAFTATTEFSDDDLEVAYKNWLPTLNRALSDPLHNLIESYAKAVRCNSGATIENLDELVAELKEASKIRNVLCHGSWRPPDSCGWSTILFYNKSGDSFDAPMGIESLEFIQDSAMRLAAGVVNSVTHMGWQFPGSSGPGEPILKT